MKKSQKVPQKYYCASCDYTTIRMKDFSKHKMTRKHEILTNPNNNSQQKTFNCECGKKYKHRSSLSYHRKTCKVVEKNEKKEKEEKEIIASTTDRKLILKLIEENKELTNKIVNIAEQPKTTINSTINKPTQFNLNIFLNETCKDAINISEFIKNLTIGIQELEFSTENGMANGISTILINGLKELDVKKRPIHCTDLKRKTLYIKDENEWEKDNSQLIEKSITKVKKKHTDAIKQWETLHPKWNESEEETEQYLDFVRTVINNMNETDENKIITNISKEVDIKEIKETGMEK